MISNFWLFALTAFLLNITPGNDMLFVIARSSAQGTKAGVISALGIGAGCIVHLTAALVGLSALIAQSALAFSIIKMVGAIYLVYLGINSIRSKKTMHLQQSATSYPYSRIFKQAALTNMLNPKVALFFLAFLPQFINSHYQAAPQILFLGLWFNISGTVVNILVALLFGKIGSFLSGSPKFITWQERISGLLLITLGLKVALSSKK